MPWPKPVTEASFSPDDTVVVAIGNDAVARVYDARTGRLLRALDQGGRVTRFAFSSGGGLLVTTGAT